MKVVATNKYKELNVKDVILNRIPEAGEEFEVTDERYELLNKNNKYKVAFVVKAEVVETATKKDKTEKAINKTTKKAK